MPHTPDERYVRYVDACDSHTKGKVYVIAMLHDVVEPYETLTPYMVELDVQNLNENCSVIIDGSKLVWKYKTPFECMCRDERGRVYIGGHDGFIQYDGKFLDFVDLKAPDRRVFALCARSVGNDVFWGDTGGGVFRYAKGKLDRQQLNIYPNWINAIHGKPDGRVVAVGDGGLVASFVNSTWAKTQTPEEEWLRAVWVVDDQEIYLGGRSGLAWRWDGGTRWVELKVERKFEWGTIFTDFAWYGNFLYAAAADEGIFRLEGDVFVPVTGIGDAYVSKLSVTESGLIGLGNVWGECGSWFTHFDGKTWSARQINVKL